jgi:hypothetical protein
MRTYRNVRYALQELTRSLVQFVRLVLLGNFRIEVVLPIATFAHLGFSTLLVIRLHALHAHLVTETLSLSMQLRPLKFV